MNNCPINKDNVCEDCTLVVEQPGGYTECAFMAGHYIKKFIPIFDRSMAKLTKQVKDLTNATRNASEVYCEYFLIEGELFEVSDPVKFRKQCAQYRDDHPKGDIFKFVLHHPNAAPVKHRVWNEDYNEEEGKKK